MMIDAVDKTDFTTVGQLRRVWHVYLKHDADVRRVRRTLPSQLSRLEALKLVDEPESWEIWRVDRQLYGELMPSVVYLHSHPRTDDDPPGYSLREAGPGGFRNSPDEAIRFVCDWIDGPNGDKLQRQLRDATAHERHAFILLGYEYIEQFEAVRQGEHAPTGAPRLPDPLDGLWVAAEAFDTSLWAWLPDHGWTEGTAPHA